MRQYRVYVAVPEGAEVSTDVSAANRDDASVLALHRVGVPGAEVVRHERIDEQTKRSPSDAREDEDIDGEESTGIIVLSLLIPIVGVICGMTRSAQARPKDASACFTCAVCGFVGWLLSPLIIFWVFGAW